MSQLTDAPHNGTETSRAAASQIREHAPILRQRILDYIRDRGVNGATADEIEVATGLAGNTVRPRLCELRGGLEPQILDSHLTRKTRTGRQAVVYIAKEI